MWGQLWGFLHGCVSWIAIGVTWEGALLDLIYISDRFWFAHILVPVLDFVGCDSHMSGSSLSTWLIWHTLLVEWIFFNILYIGIGWQDLHSLWRQRTDGWHAIAPSPHVQIYNARVCWRDFLHDFVDLQIMGTFIQLLYIPEVAVCMGNFGGWLGHTRLIFQAFFMSSLNEPYETYGPVDVKS